MPTDPIVERLNLVEEENNLLKEKIKKIEEEKMILELHVADVVNDHKIIFSSSIFFIFSFNKLFSSSTKFNLSTIGSVGISDSHTSYINKIYVTLVGIIFINNKWTKL